MIRIYNSLNGMYDFLFRKVIFIYVCGITVYDKCHIGHFRIFFHFDFFIRVLNFLGYHIVFIRNITDIDDKILNKSILKKKSFNFISRKYIRLMHYDIFNSFLIEPTFEPKATFFINTILKLITDLKKRFYVYFGRNNDIYYDIRKNMYYGRLSNRSLNNLFFSGKNKHDFKLSWEDFVLWKFDNKKFIWGRGRPGWHTECAAMVLYYSVNFIDLHSGGLDLLFPHHENELAQINCLKYFDIIKIWKHIGHLNINNKKMSKSFSNFLFVNDFFLKFNEEYLRFYFLFNYYGKPINFSDFNFFRVVKLFNRFYTLLIFLFNVSEINIHYTIKFLRSFLNDLNTAKCIAILFNIFNEIKNLNDYKSFYCQMLIYTFNFFGNLLGLFKHSPLFFLLKNFFIKKKNILIVLNRNNYRLEKNWILADFLRNKILIIGFELRDTKKLTLLMFVFVNRNTVVF